jgi:lipopolysaccharide/colanic/teichoic acid biosynthesis glycosyltransferase
MTIIDMDKFNYLNQPDNTAIDGLYEQYQLDPAYDDIAFILLAHEFNKELFMAAFDNRMDDFYVFPLPPIEDLASRIRFLQEYRPKKPAFRPRIIPAEPPKIPLSKRIFDIVVASTALFMLSPILLVVILAIKLESKGKFYYISKRVGMRKFDFYKLRSMRTGSDADLKKLAKEKNQYTSAQNRSEVDVTTPCPLCCDRTDGQPCDNWEWKYIGEGVRICGRWFNEQKNQIAIFKKISKDPRVTKVGAFIRKTSIDELPQLINVIKGDMSIVGNRPLPEYEADKLTTDEWSKRLLAPAGITGLWQVKLRGKGGVMSENDRRRYDNFYADFFIEGKYSFWTDFGLILRTFKALFQTDSV